MLKTIKQTSKNLINKFEYYKTLNLNERILYKSLYYYWDDGKACKHFNKQTRHFLDKMQTDRPEKDFTKLLHKLV